MPPSRPMCVVITTHTTRHLRRVLLGVRWQRRAPDRVVVTCDVDDEAIAAVVQDACDEMGMTITLALRPHQGQGRAAQVRNNGVRTLLGLGVGDDAGVVFLDGDCCAEPDVVEKHEADLERGAVVIGGRVLLTPEQTEAFDEDALRHGRPGGTPDPRQVKSLARRDRRYRRMLWLRPFGLTKPHKPKVLGANHAVRMETLRAVNGNDELYQQWGVEDDDLGRRIYLAGERPVVAVKRNVVQHLHHPERRRSDWSSNPSAQRLQAGGPAFCEHGLENPCPQDPVVVRTLTPRG